MPMTVKEIVMPRVRNAILALLACTVLLGVHPVRADESLYNDLGGREGITHIVDLMMTNILADDRIKHTFDDSDAEHVKKMLVEQFAQLSGGPVKYTGKDMREVHKGLHLHNSDFNALVEDLQDAMDVQHISFFTQNRLLALLAPMQPQVVNP